MGDFGLPIDSDDLAGKLMKIDALPLSVKLDLQTLMHQTFAMEACADAGTVEEIDGTSLDQTGTNSAQYMFTGPALEDHIVDTVIVQQLAQQQPRRAGADDCDLRTHHGRISSVGCDFRGRRGLPQRNSVAVPRAAKNAIFVSRHRPARTNRQSR
jgi:hypothetical protein